MFGFSCGEMIPRMAEVPHTTLEFGPFLKEIKDVYFQKPRLWEHLCSAQWICSPEGVSRKQKCPDGAQSTEVGFALPCDDKSLQVGSPRSPGQATGPGSGQQTASPTAGF